jgi:hypothetical protein
MLHNNGYTVILESEQATMGIKTPDELLNGIVMDIKAIEGTERRTIKNKFDSACSQRAKCVVLYFPE